MTVRADVVRNRPRLLFELVIGVSNDGCGLGSGLCRDRARRGAARRRERRFERGSDGVAARLLGRLGKHDFSTLTFTINGSTFEYGAFINALIAFVSAAAAVFFFVVVPLNRLLANRDEEDPTVKSCPECTSEIPVKARRCPQCTAQVVT